MSETTPQPIEGWLSEGESLPEFGSRFTSVGALGRALAIASVYRRSFQTLVAVFNSKAEARAAVDHLKFLLGAEAASRVHYIPPVDFDYYKGLFPNAEVIAERNVALYQAIWDPERRIFVTTTASLLQKAMLRSAFEDALFSVRPGLEMDRENLTLKLRECGYQKQPIAYDPGVYSVRGGVVDIYSPAHGLPLRLEFFGDEIEALRHYDPRSQRSLDPVDEGWVLPVRQSLLPYGEKFQQASLRLKQRLDTLGINKVDRDQLIADLELGRLPDQDAFLFPLLSGGSSALEEYFPPDAIWFWDGGEKTLELGCDQELLRFKKNLELFERDPTPIAEGGDLFVDAPGLTAHLKKERAYFFEDFDKGGSAKVHVLHTEPLSLETERSSAHRKGSLQPALEGFAMRFKNWMSEGYRIHLVCHTHTHEDRFRLLFEPYSMRVEMHDEQTSALPGIYRADFSKIHLWQGNLNESAVFPQLKLVLLSEEEIFGKKKRVRAGWSSRSKVGEKLASFRELKEGDFVVHKQYGIGRYLGLRSMQFLGVPNDYVLIEYKDGDKLYVPSYRLNVIQKYVGGEGATVALDKMGGERWEKAKAKAQKAVQELAGELIKIQAQRKLVRAHALPAPGQEYHQFEMEFQFDETPDQLTAIEDTLDDLRKEHPMDRLVVGDVGYGKTEVAMRAAFRMASEGRQSCVVVPTTVLAFQHYESFKERFRNTPVRIEMVSRMRKPAENKAALEALANGKVDIVVGTHRLFSADVGFKNLGLVVVDEEHRFGVGHKERLKKMVAGVHFLSMTATPIPRTLNMAMTGIKEISLITTPPPDRMSVRTFVCRRSDEVIAEAISNELTREGQVFFVHNRVETIFNVSDQLKELLPKATFEVVHGQMDGDTLEKKMLSFYKGESQVLVTTSIIESGLDIPRANTILIDRADRFGLAQLYQLRGRVGRAAKRGYCYLLVPSESQLTGDAKQRLQVIQRYADLGAGFNVASYDLEIRGAGDLLGKQQSGHINAIGVDMYFELLEEAVGYLKGEMREEQIEPEITLKIAAYFPEPYLPDISERINLYRRLASVDEEDGIADLETEIRDRFGTPPEEVKNLLGLMRIKLYLKRLHVTHMSCGPKRASLLFAPSTPVTPERIIELIRTAPKRYAVTPDNKLVFNIDEADWPFLLQEIKTLSDRLGIAAP
ncbi:MAG: transcription-repair coupling factor [Bdellovibrionales bacterium]|nr:transcription-repair coupling factor [Bdellovibrionales bacterium]